jgi:hypothetical protein
MGRLSDVLAAKLDPVAFVRTYCAVEPSPAQAEILRSAAQRAAVCCTRGFGKSTVMGWKAAHRMDSDPGALILAISPSGRQSGELLDKVRGPLHQAGHRTKGDGRNEFSLVLPNGSRFVALPSAADTIRGFHGVAMLLVEEAAFVPDAVYESARSFLAVGGGSEWLVSTPYGPRGFFWRRCTDAKLSYKAWKVTWADVPWISAEFIAEERKVKGDRLFRQEYECEFLDTQEGVFNQEDLVSAVRSDLEALVIP